METIANNTMNIDGANVTGEELHWSLELQKQVVAPAIVVHPAVMLVPFANPMTPVPRQF